jgi:hypothetical protein
MGQIIKSKPKLKASYSPQPDITCTERFRFPDITKIIIPNAIIPPIIHNISPVITRAL